MITCKHCESVLRGDLTPDALVRCGECGKKTRLPRQREFAEIAFDAFVQSPSGTKCDRDALATAIANARLSGARWRRIRASLEATGLDILNREETVDIAKGIIRAQSRADGRGMFIVGLVCTLIFVIATVAQNYLGWQTIYISASLLAIGGIYTLVGALKWVTGFNIR